MKNDANVIILKQETLFNIISDQCNQNEFASLYLSLKTI